MEMCLEGRGVIRVQYVTSYHVTSFDPLGLRVTHVVL